MLRFQVPKRDDWKVLSRNDWSEILELSQAKAFKRKFQLVEAFIKLVAEKGYHETTHAEIAKACGVTRQLVDHHFPSRRALMLLTYRYIYARFQKHAADALVSRQGTLNQFHTYVTSMQTWIRDHKLDSRFLANFYGIAPVFPELIAYHERNTKLGQERIHVLLKNLREEKKITHATDEQLLSYATSVQHQIIGFLVLNSGRKIPTAAVGIEIAEELWRSCFAIVCGK